MLGTGPSVVMAGYSGQHREKGMIMNTLTRNNVRDEVLTAIGEHASDIPNLEDLLEDLYGIAGRWTTSTISPMIFWGTVRRYDVTQGFTVPAGKVASDLYHCLPTLPTVDEAMGMIAKILAPLGHPVPVGPGRGLTPYEATLVMSTILAEYAASLYGSR